MSEKSEALQTPLPDLLDQVPDDIVLGIPGDEPMFPSYTNIPIGKLARLAAAELRRLHAENEALRRERDEARRTVREAHEAGTRLTAQRDALLEALKRMASIMDKMGDMPDGFIHPSPWQTLKCEEALTQARAAIKAVEEGK